MNTYIVYNMEDNEGLQNTLQSIRSTEKDECFGFVLAYTENDAVNKLALTNTTYSMILKAGDIVQEFLNLPYTNLLYAEGSLRAEDGESNEVRGIRFGNDILDRIRMEQRTFEDSEEFMEWIDSNFITSGSTDMIKVTLN